MLKVMAKRRVRVLEVKSMSHKCSGVRVLSQRTITRFKVRGTQYLEEGFLKCWRCGVPLRVGDSVYSCRSSRRRFYHLKCWLSLFLETKEDSLKVEVS